MDKQFQQISNVKATIHILLRAAWHASLIILIYLGIKFDNYAISCLAFYLNSVTWAFLAYAGLAHEFFHKKVFTNGFTNNLLYRLCSYLTWSNPAYFSASHLYHHQHTFDENDYESKGSLSLSRKSLFYLLLVDIPLVYRRVLYVFSNGLGYEYFPLSEVKFKKIEKIRNDIVQEARAMIFFNILFYLFLFYTLSGLTAFAVFLSSFTATLFNRILAASQHQGLDLFKEGNVFNFSRTIRLPKIVEFFYANMNYHAEHHYRPSVPFYNLPAYHEYLTEQGLLKPTTLKEFVREELFKN